jgi:PHP family Zn ribbon phosphoesterase
MSLNVLKDGSITMSHFTVLLKKIQQDYQYLFNLFHILTIDKIKYVLYDGIIFQYCKSPNFVELMLESWIFFIKQMH